MGTEPVARGVAVGLWLLVIAACIAVAIWRLRLSFDLSYFLPPAATPAEQVLHERAGDAPGSRLMLILLAGPDAAELQDAAAALTQRLAAQAAFTRVFGTAGELSVDDMPAYVMRHRYLLSDVALDAPALRAALEARFAELAMVSNAAYERLIAADPTLASVTALQALGLVRELPPVFAWDEGRHAALLVAQTRAGALALERQAQAMHAVRDAFAALGTSDVSLELYGFGVYGVELQETIRREAMLRSLLATAAVLLVLLIAFRRAAPLLLAGVPLALGFVCGMAAVAAVFGEVHGITLAFGFTLLGVAVDYPVHVLSHARHQSIGAALAATWPVIRLGAASTIIGYGSLLLTGSPGLSQLGLFSVAGLIGAAAAVRTLLPQLAAGSVAAGAARAASAGNRTAGSLHHGPWLVLGGLAAVAVLWQPVEHWNDELSQLSPVPAERLQRDNELRDRAALPNMRYLLVSTQPGIEAALEAAERLTPLLGQSVAEGAISGWLSPAAILPSDATQQRRRAGLPSDEQLRARFAAASAGLPLRSAAFEAFFADVAAAREQQISFEAARNGEFGGLLTSLLYRASHAGDEWRAMTVLYDLSDSGALAARLAGADAASIIVDMRAASQSLAQRYRRHVLTVVGVAAFVILALLATLSRERRDVVWVAGTTSAAVLASFALLSAVSGPLNVFHLVALLVVGALGLDYALFLSARHDAVASADTRHAVATCMLSTVAAFAVLATSAIPLLRAIGSTVALGALLCYATAWLGARRPAPGSRCGG